LIKIGNTVRIIKPEPCNIPEGCKTQGLIFVGKVGTIINIQYEKIVFGGISNICQLFFSSSSNTWWVLECEMELLDTLPDGVHRCKCGTTTNRKEQKCCDCIKEISF
jgi:hypothetical protein